MAENSPIRKSRISPRKVPYPDGIPVRAANVRNKGKDILTLGGENLNVVGKNGGKLENLAPATGRSPLKSIQGPSGPLSGQPPKTNLFQTLKEKTKSSNLNIFKGQQQHKPATTTTATTNVTTGTNSNITDVTSGVLSQFQPRGLNSSFSEKFQSRLGLDSGGAKENEDVVARTKASRASGILTEQHIPLFDFPEYSPEILRNLGKTERRFIIQSNYMKRHKEITEKMRTILVDWLIEVVDEYELKEETLHLAVNYLDRFLCKMTVKRTKFQLLGVAALFIATKFEETSPPEISDYVYVTDEAFNSRQILDMEKCMLQTLEFDLMVPTAHTFVSSYCSILELSDPIRSLSYYLVDLSLLDGETFLKYLPSVVAGAAVALARFSFEHIYYDKSLGGICQHRQKTLTACVRDLHAAFFSAGDSHQKNLHEKYKSIRYCSVSAAFIPHHGPWDQRN